MTEEQIAAIEAARLLGVLGPAHGAAVTSQRSALLQRREIDVLRTVGKGGYEQRVVRAVELAQEAGLAIALPRDHRDAIRLVEDVGGAHVYADVARGAGFSVDDLDHSAASERVTPAFGRVDV